MQVLQQGDSPQRGEAPKKEASAPKQEAPKKEPTKQEAPKKESPNQDAPKQDAPKQETPAPKKETAPKKAAKSDIDEHREKAPTERLPVRPSRKEEKLREPGKISDGGDHTAFNALFWSLSPLWLALSVFVYLLFTAMILTFVVLIVVFVAALLCVVIAGTALALVGIIYGATQVFAPETLAAGLYEIGQGVVIGGCTMFGGIVLYNFAVRFFPWLIKQTVHMMGGFARALKRLYYRVKGAMAK